MSNPTKIKKREKAVRYLTIPLQKFIPIFKRELLLKSIY